MSMMGQPIVVDHTLSVRWAEQVLEEVHLAEQVLTLEKVRLKEQALELPPGQIQSSTKLRGKDAVLNPDEDSKATARGFARTPARKGYENTSDPRPVPCLRQQERFQMNRDANTAQVHLHR
jgi:hypothetical protein